MSGPTFALSRIRRSVVPLGARYVMPCLSDCAVAFVAEQTASNTAIARARTVISFLQIMELQSHGVSGQPVSRDNHRSLTSPTSASTAASFRPDDLRT